MVLSEMTLHNLTSGEDIDIDDFLHRAEILCSLGKNVMISDYGEFYRLAQYLFKYTSMPVAIALGVPTLLELFDDKCYENLDGGILESFGRMFRNDLRMYVCPALDQENGGLVTVHNLKVKRHLEHLCKHLLENGHIRELATIKNSHLAIFSHVVLEKICTGDNSWEKMVPDKVAKIIRDKRLFQCRG